MTACLVCCRARVVVRTLTGAITAANALAGRVFAGKTIEVEFVPEGLYQSKFPSVDVSGPAPPLA
jgi:hypothetical protein